MTNLRVVLPLLLVLASACGPGIDVVIRNPIATRQVTANTITKPHRWQENRRGLPVGALSDSAQLLSVDEQQICFGVTMHELAAIDPNSARAKMSASKGLFQDQPTAYPNQPTVRTYQGLIPVRVPAGWQTYCAARNYNNYCVRWEQRQMYATVWRSGPVNVYESSMRMCFPNGGAVNALTEWVSLNIKAPLQGLVDGGWGLFGLSNTKEVTFTWGLAK